MHLLNKVAFIIKGSGIDFPSLYEFKRGCEPSILKTEVFSQPLNDWINESIKD